MSKKIFLSPSNQDGNHYAYGNTTEDVQCGRIAVALKSALERCGFAVKCEQYDSMQNRVAHSNAWGADMHIAVHTNATAKHTAGGTQVFYCGYADAAKAVFDELRAITPGSNAEVCRKYTQLYEVSKPNAISVYVEAEFHDVPEYAKWIVNHTSDIAEAICRGVCEYYQVKYKSAEKPKETKTKQFTSYVVRVDINDLNIRRGPGTDYPTTGIHTGKGLFTIVEESNGKGATKWGKLKSGLGWISLDYAKRC